MRLPRLEGQPPNDLGLIFKKCNILRFLRAPIALIMVQDAISGYLSGNTAMSDTAPEDRLEQFTRLWVQNQRAVLAFIHMSLRDAHHADDVLQEVAADASRYFDRYDPDRPFVAWLIGIARQRLVDHYRQQDRQKAVLSPDVMAMLDQSYAEVAEEIDDRVVALRKCIEQLPEHHKLMINRRYGYEDGLDEIAKSVGSNAKAVNAMLTRIRKALGNCIQQRMEAMP